MTKDRQPKRCKSRGPSGFRCQKPRGHEAREIDVVHQAGMLIWRHELISGIEPLPTEVTGFLDRHAGIAPAPDTEPVIQPYFQSLDEWWHEQAMAEIERTVPKAIEYSSTDLTDIGMDLARTMGREVSDEEAAELGVFFYLRGKVARWVGAVMAGQRVSDDTLFDIGVYVRMAQRIRAAGGWPGIGLEREASHG